MSLLLLLLGCETEVRFPPDLWQFEFDSGRDSGLQPPDSTPPDTEPVTLPLIVERVQWGCNAQETVLQFVTATNTRSMDAEVDLYIERATSWRETHRLMLDFDDPDLLVRSVALTHDATQHGWMPGVSTALHCTEDVPEMSFVVRAWALDGSLGDCVLWNPTDAVFADLQEDPEIVGLGGCTLLIPESPTF